VIGGARLPSGMLRAMLTQPPALGAQDIEAFQRDGYVVVPGLFREAQLRAVLEGVERLIDLKCPGLEGDLHAKVLALAKQDRRMLGKVYDAIRKLQPFWTLAGSEALHDAAAQLLGARTLGVAFRGAGIRLDLPHEDAWRSQWHQEYPGQMSSPRGVVAWFSLLPVTADMGPVNIARGSHREGIIPVRCHDPLNAAKNYTTQFEIPDVEALLDQYPVTSTPTGAGDVVFMDFMTLHQSGFNRSAGRSRVTCQVRLFDMADPTAVSHDWVGGWQEGGDFAKLHPDKVLP
jgi:ectoine hydroxylase-related dioxygenase (phytanoyl-CoA dioxygenase family)